MPDINRNPNVAIWKFRLEVTDVQDIEMPANAQILKVDTQAGDICLWAMCNKTAAEVKRRFYVVGTGHAMPIPEQASLHYLGSIQLKGGTFIFHVFEAEETPF